MGGGRASDALFWPSQTLHIHGIFINTQAMANIELNKTNLKTNLKRKENFDNLFNTTAQVNSNQSLSTELSSYGVVFYLNCYTRTIRIVMNLHKINKKWKAVLLRLNIIPKMRLSIHIKIPFHWKSFNFLKLWVILIAHLWRTDRLSQC